MTGPVVVVSMHRSRLISNGQVLAAIDTRHVGGLFLLDLRSSLRFVRSSELGVVYERRDALIFSRFYLEYLGRSFVEPSPWSVRLSLCRPSGRVVMSSAPGETHAE